MASPYLLLRLNDSAHAICDMRCGQATRGREKSEVNDGFGVKCMAFIHMCRTFVVLHFLRSAYLADKPHVDTEYY